MVNYVTGFMFSEDGKKVALIEKINPVWQRGLLNGIGGKIEADETPQQAMSREFLEETGVATSADSWRLYCIISRPGKYKINFFYSENSAVYEAKSTEKEQVYICDTSALPEKVINNLRWLIPLAQDKNLIFLQPVYLEEERITE